ncbi:hypothetical protein ACJX0J_030146, partial [Zea mays]
MNLHMLSYLHWGRVDDYPDSRPKLYPHDLDHGTPKSIEIYTCLGSQDEIIPNIMFADGVCTMIYLLGPIDQSPLDLSTHGTYYGHTLSLGYFDPFKDVLEIIQLGHFTV